MTKFEQIVEKVVVTFVEAAGAYLVVIPTVNWTKTVLADRKSTRLNSSH